MIPLFLAAEIIENKQYFVPNYRFTYNVVHYLPIVDQINKFIRCLKMD